jgi:hypothetical protein
MADAVLDAARTRATRLGVSADRVLIAAGAIEEEAYLRILGESLGVGFVALDGVPRWLCPLEDARLLEASRAGLLPLQDGNDMRLVVAPRGVTARRLAGLIRDDPALGARFRFTSNARLARFVQRGAAGVIAGMAVDRLRRHAPLLSAAPHRRRPVILPALSVAIALAFALAVPEPAALLGVLLALFFLAWVGLRLAAAFIAPQSSPRTEEPRDDGLPVYTIIAALYREARSVDGLLSAIARLDYPLEKLDVILAVEPDDRATLAAIAARTSRFPITLVTAPMAGPRTKPKALNAALPFARGAFTVVYDAEDRPEPGQLREALRTFLADDARLACVQAPLCIDNTEDSWLARMFTAEYAGQFDVFLPALTGLGLPLPLGGSSNHFPTDTLRKVGAWDPYNVTEDADLGMRLARLGYRARTIAASTYEEAPARLGPWLRQRTRWFKGWMQTWAVHMRRPQRLARELGVGGFLTFQLIVGGNALAALVHPIFLAALVRDLAGGADVFGGSTVLLTAVTALYGVTAAGGYLVSALIACLGLRRRRLLACAWALALMPVHWLLLSVAAWRALYQLIVAPYAWEKTEHGLARSSRRAARLTRSLIELEGYLRELKQRGGLIRIGSRAVPRRRRSVRA